MALTTHSWPGMKKQILINCGQLSSNISRKHMQTQSKFVEIQ